MSGYLATKGEHSAMYSGMPEELPDKMVARAIILKRWETKIVFDGFPQIGLLVEVQPALQTPFTAEIKTVVDRSRMALLQNGAVLLVSYHPQNPARISIAALPDSLESPDPATLPEPPEE